MLPCNKNVKAVDVQIVYLVKYMHKLNMSFGKYFPS